MAQQPNYGALSDYSLEQQKIDRARKYAELMQAQGQAPLGPTESVGGWAIRRSPMESVGKMAQALAGKSVAEQADADQKALSDKAREQGNTDVQNFMGALGGQEAREAIPAPPDELGGGPAAPAQAAIGAYSPEARQKALAIAMQSQNPMLQGAGSSMLADMLKPKEVKAYKPGDVLFQDGKQVGAIPAKPTEHVIDGKIYASGPNGLVEVGGPGAQQWGEPYQLGGQTVQKNNVTGQIRQAVNLPPQTRVNVNTDRSYFGNVAEGLAKQDVAAIDAARSAPQRIESARAVRQFLDKNPITGTFAEQRLSFEKGLATVGLIDGERVKNTETLASNLASQTLDAIKTSGLGSGQGFTDKDRQFLERAKSGNIEINAGTLRQLADLNEKAATVSLRRGNEIIKKLKGSNQMGQVGVGLDEIQEPTDTSGTNPVVNELLKKYNRKP